MIAKKSRPTHLYENLMFPLGSCQCGCGVQTPIAIRTDSNKGWIKDWPKLYAPQHQTHHWQLNEETGCWLWANAINQDGYGRLEKNGSGNKVLAHRFYWLSKNGPIPPKRLLYNLCGNRHCVNVDHWEIRIEAKLRKCAKCQQTLPITQFELRVPERGWYYAYCKSCNTILKFEWARNNPDKVKIYRAKYYSQNYEKCRAAEKRYQETHKEQTRLRGQKWRAENPEKALAAVHRRRARLRAVPSDDSTKLDVWHKCQGYCYLCNKYWKYEEHGRGGWHVDHKIPLFKRGPNTIDNLFVACEPCNLQRPRR